MNCCIYRSKAEDWPCLSRSAARRRAQNNRGKHRGRFSVATICRRILTVTTGLRLLLREKSNQLARAAAIQVAENPGSAYNPLFMCGGVGLGKTHLMHAIGNSILESRSRTNVAYLHSERFVADMVKALRHNTIDDNLNVITVLWMFCLLTTFSFLPVRTDRRKSFSIRLILCWKGQTRWS